MAGQKKVVGLRPFYSVCLGQTEKKLCLTTFMLNSSYFRIPKSSQVELFFS